MLKTASVSLIGGLVGEKFDSDCDPYIMLPDAGSIGTIVDMTMHYCPLLLSGKPDNGDVLVGVCEGDCDNDLHCEVCC